VSANRLVKGRLVVAEAALRDMVEEWRLAMPVSLIIVTVHGFRATDGAARHGRLGLLHHHAQLRHGRQRHARHHDERNRCSQELERMTHVEQVSRRCRPPKPRGLRS
jgi:hypothetical protein